MVDVFEAVGNIPQVRVRYIQDLECVACPQPVPVAASSPPHHGLRVGIGLALPGSAGAPAPYESRDAYAEASGRAVMNLLAQNIARVTS